MHEAIFIHELAPTSKHCVGAEDNAGRGCCPCAAGWCLALLEDAAAARAVVRVQPAAAGVRLRRSPYATRHCPTLYPCAARRDTHAAAMPCIIGRMPGQPLRTRHSEDTIRARTMDDVSPQRGMSLYNSLPSGVSHA
jgi:hypothetical protein